MNELVINKEQVLFKQADDVFNQLLEIFGDNEKSLNSKFDVV